MDERADGYSMRETETEVEVRVQLPAGTRAKDVKVSIGSTTLRVSVAGGELMDGALCGALLVDDSSWCLDHEAGEDGAPVLQLDLLKKQRTAADAPLWGRLFAAKEAREV